MDLADTLRAQDGLVTRQQALCCGTSPSTVDRRLRSGTWRTVFPGVYLVGDRDLGARRRIRAAWLWAGPSSVVWGESAAWWLGCEVPAPRIVGLTLPARRGNRPPPGIRCRRRDLPAEDLSALGGVRCTGLPLTVLEAAVQLREPWGSTLLDRALQRGVVRYEELVAAHHRNLGRRGSPAAGQLLAAAGDRTHSHAERKAVALLRAAGLTGWVVNHPVGHYVLDIAFPAARLAVEIDGWAWHSDPARFQHDRRRQNDLVAAGWTVLRFTWQDLVSRPGYVIGEIRRALIAVSGSEAS